MITNAQLERLEALLAKRYRPDLQKYPANRKFGCLAVMSDTLPKHGGFDEYTDHDPRVWIDVRKVEDDLRALLALARGVLDAPEGRMMCDERDPDDWIVVPIDKNDPAPFVPVRIVATGPVECGRDEI